jgi:hypothetical protein
MLSEASIKDLLFQETFSEYKGTAARMDVNPNFTEFESYC